MSACKKGYTDCHEAVCLSHGCSREPEPETNEFLEKIKTISISSKATPTRGKK